MAPPTDTPPPAAKTPGQLILRLMEERGWSRIVLATVMGVPSVTVGRLIKDTKPVDAGMALILAEVFPVPAEDFLRLQMQYDIEKAKLAMHPDPRRGKRAKMLAEIPVAEMVVRGWLDLPDQHDIAAIERELIRFFAVDDPASLDVAPHVARRANVGDDVTPVQLTWLRRVQQMASAMVVPPYSTAAMHEAVRELHKLLASPSETRRVPRILTDAGVRFLVVESLQNAKIDGVCYWLDARSPVIALSMRYDRIDNFWFVLRHECEHVLRGHGLETAALDISLERERAGTGETVDEQERVANDAAANFCVQRDTLMQFIARKAPIFTERDIVGFARLVNVHPGLVAGQLQHATARYERFRDHLVKVRDVVLPNVLHDGWGDVAPTHSPT